MAAPEVETFLTQLTVKIRELCEIDVREGAKAGAA
jgi:hypothetical protein